MKIAHITTHLNRGGIPAYILTLTQALRLLQTESIVISSGGTMENEFKAGGTSIWNFPIKTKFEFHPKLFLALPKIVKIIRSEKVDLLHAHTRVAQVLAWFISQQTGIPFVATCHGFYQPRFGRRIFPAWGKRAIAISEGVKTDLITRHRVRAEKIQTVHNGVDVSMIQSRIAAHSAEKARAHFGFKPDDFVAGIIARLVKEKGTDDFLEALHKLLPRYPQLRGLVVGDGREKTALEAKVRSWGLTQKIIFTGRCDDVFLPLAACDVFVHPARWAEAFGLSLIEAMAAGKPVLMTRHWALYDFLKDKGACFFVEKENIPEIQSAIETWIQNPQKVTQMGQAAGLVAQSHFTSERMASEINQIYRALVQG